MKMVFTAAAALGALIAAPAMAEAPSRYIQGNLGAVIDSSFDFEARNGPNAGYGQDFDGGVYASIAVGQAMTSKWTLEGEVIYADADIDITYNSQLNLSSKSGSITPKAQAPESYSVTTYGLLLNANYEVYRAGSTSAYVGAGAGFGYTEYEEIFWQSGYATDDSGVMWQLKAGVTHDLNEQMAVDVSYRYLNAPEVSGYGDAADMQALTVGLRYSF